MEILKESLDDFAHQQLPFKRFGDDVSRLLKTLEDGTYEAKYLLSKECHLLYECKVCRSIFRSSVNYIDHKRNFCTDLYDYYMHVVNSYRSNSENVSLVPATSQSSEKSASKENKTNSSVEITNRQSKRKRQCNSQNSNSEVTVNVSIPNPALLIPSKPTQTVIPKPDHVIAEQKPTQTVTTKPNPYTTVLEEANVQTRASKQANILKESIVGIATWLKLRSRNVERIVVESAKKQRKKSLKRRKTEIVNEETVNECLNEDSTGLTDEQSTTTTECTITDSVPIENAIDAYAQIGTTTYPTETSSSPPEAWCSIGMVVNDENQSTANDKYTSIIETAIGLNEQLATTIEALDAGLTTTERSTTNNASIEMAIDPYEQELGTTTDTIYIVKPTVKSYIDIAKEVKERVTTTSATQPKAFCRIEMVMSLSEKHSDSVSFITKVPNQINKSSSDTLTEQEVIETKRAKNTEDDSEDDVIIISDDDDDNMKSFVLPSVYRLTQNRLNH